MPRAAYSCAKYVASYVIFVSLSLTSILLRHFVSVSKCIKQTQVLPSILQPVIREMQVLSFVNVHRKYACEREAEAICVCLMLQDQLVTEMYTFFAREGELSQVLLSVRHFCIESFVA